VELIIERAPEKNIAVKIIPGMSFLDMLYARLQINPSAFLADSFNIARMVPKMHNALVITQVFDQKSASDTKLTLMNYFDDNHPVTVAINLGLSDEKILKVPLYELDRLREINHLTCVYVPPKNSFCCDKFSFDPVVDLVAKLRSPGGCVWDIEQTSQSMGGYMLEEAYEVLEAIDLNDSDLLLHIVFQARIAEENNLFSMQDVVQSVCDKMIRRHPHVFGDVKINSAADVVVNWDKIKKQEKNGCRASFLDGIPKGAPSLLRAFKLQSKAAKAGFDWNDLGPVWEKVDEELAELKEAVSESQISGKNKNDKVLNKVKSELGDTFFALVNLARFLGADSETALNAANNKFARRFRYMEEQAAKQNRSLLDFDLEGLDMLWEEAKKILNFSS
jgi:tetrapyrrole methylase family protein/MazG family protein